jgi:hypothetical protein
MYDSDDKVDGMKFSIVIIYDEFEFDTLIKQKIYEMCNK